MTIVGTVRPRGLGTYKLYIDTATGPASYATGGFTVTVDGLTNVEKAVVIAGGGYTAEVTSISDNTLTIVVYSSAGTEVTAGTDLSGVTFVIIALGT